MAWFPTEVVVSGLLEGAILSLLALGLSLIFGVMKIVNVAHGDFMIFGAFITFWLFSLWGIDPFISLLVSVPLLFLVGMLVYKFIVGPSIRHTEHLMSASMLVTYGLALFIAQAELLTWSPNYRRVITSYSASAFTIGDVQINIVRLIVLISAIAITGLLFFTLQKTKFGRALRACSYDREAAMYMGVNFDRMAYITFGISLSILSLAGMLYMLIRFLNPASGLFFTIKAFVVLIVGGMGSIAGPLLVGLGLGVSENLGAYYISPLYKDIVAYMILLLILTVRPTGLFGRRES